MASLQLPLRPNQLFGKHNDSGRQAVKGKCQRSKVLLRFGRSIISRSGTAVGLASCREFRLDI